MKTTKYTGIIPPLVTPLDCNYHLDESSLEKLIDHTINGGVSGLFINGTSGEALRLTDDVWEHLTRKTLAYAGNRVPIFCGAIDTSTARTIERIKKLEDMGASIAVSTPPFYLANFGQDEILRHYDAICNATSIEIAVYNIPENTHANILPETIGKLAEYENIVAYKDSSADWQQLQRILFCLRDKNIAVFNGAEELCAVSMLYHADGCIPGLANFIPKLFVELSEACITNDVERTYELQRTINAIRQCIFVNNCWMSGMKALLDVFHFGNDIPSPSLLPLSSEEKEQMLLILKENMILL